MRRFSMLFIALSIAVALTGCKGAPKGTLSETKNKEGIREGRIIVKGGNVWYKIVGADKNGVPLIVVHGGPGMSHDYLEPLQALSDERPVIFYDQLDCGNSAKPKMQYNWTLKRSTKELHQVRDALKLKKVHILGHGWGTMVVANYMLFEQKPDWKIPVGVVSIVLSSPRFSATYFINDQKNYFKNEFTQAALDVMAKAESTGDFRSKEYLEVTDLYYKRHLCRLDPWPESLKRAFEKMNRPLYEYMWGPSEFTMTGMLRNYEYFHRLADIRVPALFTCGQYDEAAPATTAQYRSQLPGAEIAFFKDASSNHHLEKPIEYIKKVRDFLRRAEAEAAGKRWF
jgi:proline iminopeptidase